MFGKTLSEYFHFQRWILILIAAAFLVRLGLSVAGVPFQQARWVSINVVLLVGLVYAAVAVHTTGFGSYKQLFGLLLIQSVFAQALISLAIIFGIVTGIDNVFTVPEVTGGNDGKTWLHVVAHIMLAVVAPVIGWLIASVILFATKKLKPESAIAGRA
jgi:hypothetical protein